MNSFWHWWQNLPQHINPVLLQLGPMQVRYYGVMYLLSFLVVYSILIYRIKKERFLYTKDQCEDFIIWAVCGALIGGRIGYVLFYDFHYFIQSPLQVILPFGWDSEIKVTGISGLSYHGGLVGVFIATAIFCRRNKFRFWSFVDFFIPAVPLGYTCGRIGNFLNGELWGRVTNVPWGMYFPGAMTHELRHPSQLYEAFGEGIVLFIVLWALRENKLFKGYLFWIYVLGYGIARFGIEFYRQPDEHLGLLAAGLSMGQWLTIGMLVLPLLMLMVRPYKVEKEYENRH